MLKHLHDQVNMAKLFAFLYVLICTDILCVCVVLILAWLLLTQALVLQMLIRNYSQMMGPLFPKLTLKLSPHKMSLTN